MIPPTAEDVKAGRQTNALFYKNYNSTEKIPRFLKRFEAYVDFITKFLDNINILRR